MNTFAVAAVDSAGNRSVLSNVISESFEGCVFLRRLPQGGVPDGP